MTRVFRKLPTGPSTRGAPCSEGGCEGADGPPAKLKQIYNRGPYRSLHRAHICCLYGTVLYYPVSPPVIVITFFKLDFLEKNLLYCMCL